MISTETSATVIVLLPWLGVGYLVAVAAFLGLGYTIVQHRRAKER